jgi:large subunit ribosomal protein L6
VSRIGRLPVSIPKGVEVEIKGSQIRVKGPKGELERTFPSSMEIVMENGEIQVKRPSDESSYRALHGMTRALIANMVTGVSTGFEKILEVNGVGYRAEIADGKTLILYVGYSHPVVMEPPVGISFDWDVRARQIKVMGYDKEMVGQVAANVRKVRPPEPYKGKGIKYLDEKIRRKAGKSGKV